jgi:hypothetical protein
MRSPVKKKWLTRQGAKIGFAPKVGAQIAGRFFIPTIFGFEELL